MKTILLSFLFSLLFFVSSSQTANISGIINSYTGVTAVGSQSVSVISASGFSITDRVVIIQMKGATINTSNSTFFGTITSYNNAGNYELATISAISGTTITFTNPLLKTYTSTGLVQLVKVPAYVNVLVTGLLTCLPWNGTIGGVLAFEASGTITLNADIDVSGDGFLGGALSNGSLVNCAGDSADYVSSSTSLGSGRKGEGIVMPNLAMSNGKGPYANGGGSGTDCNGGGAGGGNYGQGGHGGDSKCNVSCPPYFYQNSGGYAGGNLLYSNSVNKIFLGGGGGAGHQNNNVGSAGTSGGGIVFIRGTSLTGNGNHIKSNGTDNNIVAGNDGQGGGGSGGTVLLDLCSANSLNVTVKGGKGGVDNFTGTDCHGKGGGGGGGIIWVSSSLTGITSSLVGGLPGIYSSSGSLCYNTGNGAIAGQSGGTLTGLVIPGTSPMLGSSFVIDTSICINSTIQLSAPASASYTWSTGNSNQSITVGNTGTYWVQAQLANGCGVIDTFKLNLVSPSMYNVIRDTTLCNSNSSYQLNAVGSGASSYMWSTGSTNSSINITGSGIYWVDMQIDQCIVRDSATVTFINLPGILKDTFLCNTNQVELIPSISGAPSYQWSTGANTFSITAAANGYYWVDFPVGQCTQRDSFKVVFISSIDILKDTTACGDSYSLNVSSVNGSSYYWSTGDTTSSIVVSDNGYYWVNVRFNLCVLRDSAKIKLIHYPVINADKEVFICVDPVLLTINNPESVITWFDGSHLSSHTVLAPGFYYVAANDSGCISTDTIKVKQIQSFSSAAIPNIFTPNNDGINDFFEVNNVNIKIKEFTIYNRWGKLVYKTYDSIVKWDGKQNNGICDDDTYFWVGVFNDLCDSLHKDIKKTGFFTLLK